MNAMARDKAFDGLKYILIVLVVVGHFIEPSRYENRCSCILYSVIYAFHMPLFIWISGYFYKRRSIREEIRKCAPLLEICLVSHLGYAILKYGSLNVNNILDFSYTPSWFLLSLVFWRLSSSLLLVRIKPNRLLTLSIAIEIATFLFVPKYGGVLSFMRTVQFFPFFVAGYCMRDKLTHFERYRKHSYVLGILALVFIIFSSCRLQHQIEFQRAGLMELTHHTDFGTAEILIFRYATVISSIIISIAILQLIRQVQTFDYIVKFGGETLFIYFWQTLLTPIVTGFTPGFIESIMISAIAICIITVSSKSRFLNSIIRPFSLMIRLAKSTNKIWAK